MTASRSSEQPIRTSRADRARAALGRWWDNSRFLDFFFFGARDGRSRTPSAEYQRREAMLAEGRFPAWLLIGSSESALTIEGALAAILPVPKRNWLYVLATSDLGEIRLQSLESEHVLDQTYKVQRATITGKSTPLDGPTKRIAVTCIDAPGLILAVGKGQAERVALLLNRPG